MGWGSAWHAARVAAVSEPEVPVARHCCWSWRMWICTASTVWMMRAARASKASGNPEALNGQRSGRRREEVGRGRAKARDGGWGKQVGQSEVHAHIVGQSPGLDLQRQVRVPDA